MENHQIVNGELFTATADLEVLHDVEAVLIANIKQYIAEHEQKLDLLEKYIKHFIIIKPIYIIQVLIH